MKRKINFLVYPLAVILMSLFVIAGCSDDDTDPNFILNLEVNPKDSGTVTGAGEYQEGEQVNITATANEGWEFVNWTGDSQFLDNANSYNTTVSMPATNITLTANFQIEESNVVYGDGVTDIDGNEYVTVIIGNQEWMAENLRVTKYNNGDAIPTGLGNTDWWNTMEGAYAICYNNNNDMLEAYGKHYNWYTVNDPRGLCPEGWSVPSDADWKQLVDYVIEQGYPNEIADPKGTGNALKSCRQIGSPFGNKCDTSEHPRWNALPVPEWNIYGFDEFGFSAFPGGTRWGDGDYDNVGFVGYWWSSSEHSSAIAWGQTMAVWGGSVRRLDFHKTSGFSLRCIRD